MKNLMDAFAGESQANRKYLAYAKQAEKDGHTQVAKLFRAVAEAETIHAHAHLKVAGKINSTEENLKDAVAGEKWEFTDMYPEMIKKAEEEGNKKAVKSFTWANEVEKVHAELYQNALDNLGSNEDVDYYICPLCGHTVAGKPEENCPICLAKASSYFKAE
jgi:rubrerythrin